MRAVTILDYHASGGILLDDHGRIPVGDKFVYISKDEENRTVLEDAETKSLEYVKTKPLPEVKSFLKKKLIIKKAQAENIGNLFTGGHNDIIVENRLKFFDDGKKDRDLLVLVYPIANVKSTVKVITKDFIEMSHFYERDSSLDGLNVHRKTEIKLCRLRPGQFITISMQGRVIKKRREEPSEYVRRFTWDGYKLNVETVYRENEVDLNDVFDIEELMDKAYEHNQEILEETNSLLDCIVTHHKANYSVNQLATTA